LLLSVLLLVTGGVVTAAAAPADGTLPSEVYVGGMPFGVKFYTEGILVVGFCDVDVTATGGGTRTVNPARTAGIKMRDVITAVNGKAPAGAASLTKAVEESGGKPVSLTVKRYQNPHGGSKKNASPAFTELTITVTPTYSASENRYKTGLWVRDSGAGIGTVTFIVPGSNTFGGLGHGICDSETGKLIPMQRGQVTDVTVSGVDKGAPGAPMPSRGILPRGRPVHSWGTPNAGSTASSPPFPRRPPKSSPWDAATRCGRGRPPSSAPWTTGRWDGTASRSPRWTRPPPAPSASP
jgi:membrane-associated protease RseP (regulator of RpoE activity)